MLNPYEAETPQESTIKQPSLGSLGSLEALPGLKQMKLSFKDRALSFSHAILDIPNHRYTSGDL